MSQENVESARAIYERFATTGTVDFSRFSPDVVWDMSNFASWPEQPLFKGHAGVAEFIETWLEPWDEYEQTLEELLDADQHVVGILRISGTAKQSGARVEMPAGHVLTFIDDLLVRVDLYSDPKKALEAAGLSA
jgi:ketosteroid isomerase-like protein